MYQRQKRFLLLSSLILFCVGYRGHIEYLFARSAVFHVFQINKLQLVEFIYHYFNMPYVFNDYLSTLSNIHDYEYQLRPAFSRISNTQFNNPHCWLGVPFYFEQYLLLVCTDECMNVVCRYSAPEIWCCCDDDIWYSFKGATRYVSWLFGSACTSPVIVCILAF